MFELLLMASAAEVPERRACPAAAAVSPVAEFVLPFASPAQQGIILAGKLNGQPVRMLLDSGAEASIVDQDLALRIGLAVVGAETARGPAGSAQVSVHPGATLALGPVELAGVTLYGTDLKPLSQMAGERIDVILGAEVFDAFVLQIDFPARSIRFTPAGRFRAPARPAVVLTRTADGVRAVALVVEGQAPVSATFDLGSTAPIALRPEASRQLGLPGSRPMSATPAAGVGGSQPARLVRLAEASVGPLVRKNVPAMLLAERPDDHADAVPANVGLPFFVGRRLVVDFCGDRLWTLAR